MRIQVHKGGGRHRLICVRDDGSTTQSATGPGLPAHDLAHFVAERALGLRRGFFGNVAAGRTIAELGDPAVIRTLDAEAWAAETLARALGATATGGCRVDELPELVRAELGPDALPALDREVARAMAADFAALLAAWSALPEGEALALEL
ncbi:MAG: hypothetical protein ACXVDD_06920 [Polyangia bacterium]